MKHVAGYDRDETDNEVSDSSDSSAEEDKEEKEKQLFKRKHSHVRTFEQNNIAKFLVLLMSLKAKQVLIVLNEFY